jgi:hypothetical protein
MHIFKIDLKNGSFIFLKLLLLFVLFQSCKLYKDPISVDQAVEITDKTYFKVTLMNGDEFIYDSIDLNEGNYYGIYTKDEQTSSDLLKKENIKSVEQYNKKTSKKNGVVGVGIGVLAVVFGAMML